MKTDFVPEELRDRTREEGANRWQDFCSRYYDLLMILTLGVCAIVGSALGLWISR